MVFNLFHTQRRWRELLRREKALAAKYRTQWWDAIVGVEALRSRIAVLEDQLRTAQAETADLYLKVMGRKK